MRDAPSISGVLVGWVDTYTAPVADNLPFTKYPGGGKELLGAPRSGDGTARRSYERQVHEWCGYRCAYCNLDLGTFEGWLQLSVDHVVPQQIAKQGWPKEWIRDTINIVACCGACNGLFNRDPAVAPVPDSFEAFLMIRDALFEQRRDRIRERREVERTWFDTEIAPSVRGSGVRSSQG